jgi:hypothetical protein
MNGVSLSRSFFQGKMICKTKLEMNKPGDEPFTVTAGTEITGKKTLNDPLGGVVRSERGNSS